MIAPLFLMMLSQLFFAAIFTQLESWSLWKAFYHCMVTATTVGYGDIKIKTRDGKMWAIVHILWSVCAIGALLADLDKVRERRRTAIKRAKLLQRKLDTKLIVDLDKDGKGVDRFEFVIGMLTQLGLVAWSDVEPFVLQFEKLDADGNGRLNQNDLVHFANEYKSKYTAAFRKVAAARKFQQPAAVKSKLSQLSDGLAKRSSQLGHGLAKTSSQLRSNVTRMSGNAGRSSMSDSVERTSAVLIRKGSSVEAPGSISEVEGLPAPDAETPSGLVGRASTQGAARARARDAATRGSGAGRITMDNL
eukprot:2995097-Prymnesium_polylepis.1